MATAALFLPHVSGYVCLTGQVSTILHLSRSVSGNIVPPYFFLDSPINLVPDSLLSFCFSV